MSSANGFHGGAETGMADIVRADAALRLNGAALAMVARMVGLRVRAAAPPPGLRPSRRASTEQALPEPAGPAAGGQDTPLVDTRIPTLTPVARGDAMTLPVGVDPFPAVLPHQLVPVLTHIPLLRRTGAREVLDVATATHRFSGDIDIDRLVADIAAGRPTVRLPRRPLRTFDAGVDVLVDRGRGMQPFRRDVEAVVEALHRLVGDGLRVTPYYTTPWTEGWRPIDDERPVLLLGTLGCGRVPDVEAAADWALMIPALRRRGPRITALVPVPRRHWPPALAATRTLVPWDVTTRAKDALRP